MAAGPINGKVKRLYDALKADGGDVGTEQEFNDWFFAPGERGYRNRRQVYDTFKADGADVGANYEEFRDWLGLKPASSGKPGNPSGGYSQRVEFIHDSPGNKPPHYKDRAQIAQELGDVNTGGWLGGLRGAFRKAKDVAQRAVSPVVSGLSGGQPAQKRQASSQKGWQPTWQDKQGMLDAVDDLKRQVVLSGRTLEAGARYREELLRQRPLGAGHKPTGAFSKNGRVLAGPMRYNPSTKQMEDTYLTEAGVFGNEFEANAVQDQIDEARFQREYPEEYAGRELKDLVRRRSELHQKLNEKLRKEGVAVQYRQQIIENDEEYRTLSSAIAARDKELRALRNKGGGFLSQVVEFFSNPWSYDLFGITDVHNAGTLRRVAGKLERGEVITQSEKDLLASVYGQQSAEAMLDDRLGFKGKAGRMTAEMAPFIVKILLTGGLGNGVSEVFRQGGRKLAAGLLKNGARDVAMKRAAAWTLKNMGVLAGETAAGVVQANTVGMGDALSDIARRRTGNLVQDGSGGLKFEGAKSWGEAIYKGITSNSIEYVTERMGEHLAAGGLLKWASEKKGLQGISRALTDFSNTKTMQATYKWLKKGGVHGIPAEALEEELGIVLNAMLTGDNSLGDLIDPEQQALIWGGMAMSVGAMQATAAGIHQAGKHTGKVYDTAQYYNHRRKLGQADAVAAFRMTADRWQPLREKIDATTNEDMGAVAKGILQDDGMHEEEKRAALKYAGELLQMRGYCLGSYFGEREQARRKELYAEIRPVGRGRFGGVEDDVFDQFKGNASDAADFLLRRGGGIASDVFTRKGFGGIGLAFGNEKGGLRHMILRHVIEQSDYDSVEDLVESIEDTLEHGEQTIHGDNIVFTHNGEKAVCVKDEKGHYILTAYDITRTKEEKRRSEADATRLYQDIFDRKDGNLVPSSSASAGSEGTDILENVQAAEDENESLELGEASARGYEATGATERRDLQIGLDIARDALSERMGEDEVRALEERGTTLGIDDDVTAELAGDYLRAVAAYNGMIDRINDEADIRAAQQREDGYKTQHKEDGSFHTATLKEKDDEGHNKQVYIVDGNVQMMPDGSMVDPEASDKSVVVYEPATGKKWQLDPTADTGISSLGEVTTAEQREADIERSRQEYVQAQIDEAQGTVRLAPGQQLVLPTGEEAVVVATDADGENITVALGDGTQATVQRSELQRIRDEKAAADYRQRHGITEEPATQQPEASTPAQPQADGRVAGAPADYTADMELTIRDEDGTEKPAMVMGRVRYENGSFVPDANGNIIEYFMDGEVKHDHEDKLVDKVVSHTAYTEGSDEVQNGKDEVQSNIEIPPTHTYNLDDDLTLQTEDGTVQGTVIAEENGDGLITVQTEQPIGGRVVNLFTREQLDAMTGAAQPADMYKEQVVDAASTISEEKTADGHVSPTATQNAGRMEIPVEKRGKKEVKQYHRVPVERTLEELYDGGLDQQQVDGYVDAQIAEAAKEAERLSARKVPVTTDLDAYKQAVADNNAALADAEERKAYWERVRGEIKRITHSDETERLAVDADKEDLDYGEPRDGYEFAAMRLGSNGIRITPESFRRETGYGRGEVRQMAGVLARAENGGVSVERAAEMLVESDEGDRFFGGDSSVARDVILDVLQDGNPRGYVRRRREAQAAAQRRAEESERDAFFMEAYHMSYEDYMAYEEQLIPSFIEKYRNFDAREFDGMVAEKVATESQQTGQTELKANENNGREEQTGVVAEGGGTGNGGGGEVLPAEGSADGAGSGIGNRRGGEAAAGREGAAADGAVPEGAPGGGTAETSDASVEVRDNDGRGGNGSLTGREQGDLAQTESLKYQLSDEVDENGQQFVLNSEGNIEFGRIGEETGLTPAPILLSEGVITNQNTNAGYGLVHIEARHGDQIRAAGYNTVLEFIEEVAKNYEVIRKGNDRNGRETYMLQLTDKHNNTLMVELSGDGTYWNINTAGIFKTSYGANRTVVYNRHTTDNQPAGTDEASLSGEQSGTTPSTRMNAPTQRGLSETSAKTEPQQPNNAVSDGSSLSADEERGITPAEPNGEPTVSAGKGSASSADGKGNGGENDAAANLGSTDSPEATDIPGYGRGEVREQKAGEGAFVPTENEGMFVEAMAEHLNAMGVETFADAETGQRMLDEVNGKAALSRGQKRLLDTAPLIQKEGSPADISSSDGAKVLQNLNNLASELEKISSWRKNILSEIAKAIGAKAYGSSSKYATFTTKNGQTVTVRLGNHNAQTESFDVNGEANGISIVISKRANNGINNNGKAHLVEFFYPEIALRKAEGKPLAEIVRSIEQALYSGEYKDTTGLAEREEVNVGGVQMQKAAPVFYSNAERAVDGVKQEKATAEQWLAMIQKQGGLKAGEDKWLGLSDWLKSRSGESLTKREVLDFIRENQIRVEEVAYGDAPVALSEDGQKRFQELKEKFDGWSSEEGSETAWWRLYDEVEKLGVIRQHSADSIAAAAFDVDDDGKLVIIDERAAALLFDDNKKPINSTRLAYTTEGLQNKREIALTVPSVEPWNESDEIHFGDAGGGRAVAWVRFGETRDREGKRVLVIDEIQSKRHQEGREKGYVTEDDKTARRLHDEYVKAHETANSYETELQRKYGEAHVTDHLLTAEEQERRRVLWAASQQARDADRAFADSHPATRLAGGVPDAPFEKNWHELAMKRMLRYAAENGYDKVAWTTGEQQAERYDLGHSLKTLNVVRRENGNYDIFGKRVDSERNTPEAFGVDVPENELADIVGKDIARQAVENGEVRLKGEGLRIGGEGMKGFYDQMLPRFMDKYGRKWGVKTEDVSLSGLSGRNGRNGLTMHAVDVTPEMKASVMEGQPMFFRTADGEAYGFTLDGRIYLDPRIATRETPLHEYDHLWSEALERANPEAWEHLKERLRGNGDLLAYVKGLYPELTDENALMHEVFSHFAGRRGAERMKEMEEREVAKANGIFEKARIVALFQKLRDMLREYWTMARDLFAGNNAKLRDMSAEDFADMAMSDFVRGFNPGEEFSAANKRHTAADVTDKTESATRDAEYKRLVDIVEKPQRIEKLRRSEPVVATGDEYKGKYELNNKSAATYINEYLRDKYTNADTGEEIKITRKGAFKVTHHDAENEAHLKSIALIPQMLEKAVFISEENNDKATTGFDSYRYYVVGLKMGGVDYTAKLVVGVKDGQTYYDHALTEIEKTDLLDRRDEISSSFTDKEATVSVGKDKRLLDILQVNPQEIVDAESRMREILDEVKREKGYTSDSDYQGSVAFNGAAPSRNAYFETEEERAEAFRNGDFEGDYSLADFMDSGLDNNDLGWQLDNPVPASGRDKATLASIYNLRRAVKGGKRTIKMFRAVPSDVKEGSFRNGDWVTPSREYAERHIGLQDWQDGRIIEQEVPVDDIWWNGDDINEWGYDNGHGEVYKNTENNRKSDELITRDESGRLILPSERFDESKHDVRFSRVFGGNRGYVGYSKSRRAVDAERRGLRSKSQMDKSFAEEVNGILRERGAEEVSLSKIKKALGDIRADEWHHTSKFGNRTDYYSAETVADHFTPEEEVPDVRSERDIREERRRVMDDYIYEHLPTEDVETRIGEKKAYKTREGLYVEVTHSLVGPDGNVRDLNEDGRLIAAGKLSGEGNGVIVDGTDDWYYEHREEFQRAMEEYAEAVEKVRKEYLEREDATDVPGTTDIPGATDIPGSAAREVATESQQTEQKRSAKERREREAYAQRQWRRAHDVARETIEKLNIADDVTVYDYIDEVPGAEKMSAKQRRGKGWYDPKTGKIVIVLGNHRSPQDVMQTVLHEGVAHYGLRKLFGKNFDTFLDNVYQHAEEDVRRRIVELAMKKGFDFREATEEYLASLAEDTDFENADARSWAGHWFNTIKQLFLQMLHKIGLRDYDGVSLSDNELRYILWRSYKNLSEPGHYRNFFSIAEDIVMQDKMQVGNYAAQTEPIMEETMQTAESGLMFRDGDFTPRDRTIARDEYERMVSSGGYQFQEAVQDSMLGLKRLYQAVLGKKTHIEDVAGFENAYLAENRMSSVNAAEQHEYYVRYMKPLLDAIGKTAGSNTAKRQELTDYLMAKHGLERNEVMAQRDFDAYQQQYPSGTKSLADFRERDYAGLTALTGEDDVVMAEQLAQQMVDDYERDNETTELWQRINEATAATLAKIYNSGLLSKERYEKIRDMFEYYIPLQGWDETTSDEVYGYLTSKNGPLGGSPIKHAKGRSSKADDPIATIAMMADDAIRQGNRNKMKQTFLNFVLNHQSDLVSVNDLWLQYNAVSDEWEPVFADIENGDTAADVERKVNAFEERMEQLAESDPDNYKRGRDAQNIPYKVVKGNLKEHQVLVRRNGRTYVLTINGNPRATQALNGLTNPDVETGGVIGNMMQGAQWLNRNLSAFYTTRNPDFVVSNFFRDMLYSNCMTWVKENPKYALRFHRNFGRVNPAKMRVLLGKWENGTLDESNYIEKLFKQFMLNGGETGYTNVKDIEGHKREIAAELKRSGSNVRKAWSWLGEQLDLLNGSAENCARFAAFVTSREMGRTIERSIYDAKEVSVNFNKKGSGGKMLGRKGQERAYLPLLLNPKTYFKKTDRTELIAQTGSYIGGGGRLLYVFWNAGVQGTTNFARAAKRHPVKATAGAASMFMLGAVIPLLAQAMGGGGDDDKNAYYNLPEYVRRSNIIINAGDQWIAIPLPIEFRALYGLGELATGVISGNERYSDSELAFQMGSQVSQILPLDMLEGGGGINPSAVQKHLKTLQDKGYMERTGTNKNVRRNILLESTT